MTSFYPARPIVLVDDEPDALLGMRMTLMSAGFNHIVIFENGGDALFAIEQGGASLAVLDMLMPGRSGDAVLREIKKIDPSIPVIMATGVNAVKTAVDCLKAGANDYIVKPIDADDLVRSIRSTLRIGELEEENRRLTEGFLSSEIKNPAVFEPIITRSPKMLALFRYIEATAVTDCPILITGETGVGKELVARAVHDASGAKGDFVAVNTAGLDDTVFSDTLFGHAKGAYTGADRARAGLVERAAGGTLFLDEIGDLSPSSQVKLLRLIQEREYLSLGADLPKPSRARIVTATCRTKEELSKGDRFRRDLWFRLSTHHVRIPPLRERGEDIEPLVDHFIDVAAEGLHRIPPSVPREALSMLKQHRFEGNVRELRSMIFDAVSVHSGESLSVSYFQERLGASSRNLDAGVPTVVDGIFVGLEELPSLKEIQHVLIEEALRRSDGVHTAAARMLGITPQALGQRLKKKEP